MSSLANDLDHLDDVHLRSIVDLIERRVGIQLPAVKRTMLEGRLRRRVRALGLDGLHAYGRHLFDEGHLAGEFSYLVDCVTTNKTDFFREAAHFDLLRRELVPQLARQAARDPWTLKVWSAASSNGAEAYTIAMVLQAMVTEGHRFTYAILGTDVSMEVLAVAAAGIYPTAMLAEVPSDFRSRYVMESRDPDRAEGRIVPEIRRRVRFQHLNLMDAHYAVDRDVDIIFCRNVLIYFDKPTQKAVLSRLGDHLRPGGFLVVGHSESMAGAGVPGISQISSTLFRK